MIMRSGRCPPLDLQASPNYPLSIVSKLSNCFSLKYTEAAQDWDYLVFSQCWPATVCKIWMESNSSNTCAFPQIKDAWSIHGIWPSLEGSSGPEFCNQTWRFEPEEVTPLESELEQGWINVQNGEPSKV
ncbi:Ribonuclease X25 [Operophtera brumata]|uniref:Ribonuclease X25 n=1 Tax=Operophtera brumata TaxID=104452 RepID=A0A0L7KA52_OPEBR|nr:Ribonuclease X25 [Operophtera brumata]